METIIETGVVGQPTAYTRSVRSPHLDNPCSAMTDCDAAIEDIARKCAESYKDELFQYANWAIRKSRRDIVNIFIAELKHHLLTRSVGSVITVPAVEENLQ